MPPASLDFGRAAARFAGVLARPFMRFRRSRDGAVAVEFGIVAVPFIGLIFAILETCLVFLTGQALETAVTDASRLIFTGQAQSGGFDAARFKTEVCNRMRALVDCGSSVFIDVRAFNSFSSATVPTPVSNGQLVTNNLQYQPGSAGQIVVVRAFVAYPVYVSVLGTNLGNLNGNKRLVMATAAFRNEPFGS